MDEYDFNNTLSKLYYLIRCVLAFVVRGRAVGQVKNPKSVVIIQGAQMGDMVCTTPMFRAVKRSYPDAKLIVIGKPVNRETLQGNPDVDEYIDWKEDIASLIPILKKERCDFGCVTSPNFPAVALMYLAGVTVIAAPTVTNGWSPYMTKPYRFVLPLITTAEHRMRNYAPREYLKLLAPAGIVTEDTKKFVYFTEQGRQAAHTAVTEIRARHKTLVGILPGAGNAIKQWMPERFAEVAKYCIEKYGVGILILGTNATRAEADIILSQLPKEHVCDLTGALALDATKALYTMIDLVVAVDTGPMFFAEAHGTPTVDICGNIDENEQAPNDGKSHLVVVPPNRGAPEVLTMNAKFINYKRAKEQINSVTVPMVTAVIDTIMPRVIERQAERQ